MSFPRLILCGRSVVVGLAQVCRLLTCPEVTLWGWDRDFLFGEEDLQYHGQVSGHVSDQDRICCSLVGRMLAGTGHREVTPSWDRLYNAETQLQKTLIPVIFHRILI